MRALATIACLAAAGAAAAQDQTPGAADATRAGPSAAQAPLIAAVPDAAETRGVSGPGALPSEQAEGELLSSDLVGRPLHGRDGRRLGEISDLLVDRNRRLAAVVVTLDAIAGNRGKSVAIPFDALRRSAGDRRDIRLIVDFDEVRLREAKAFEPLSREAGQDDNQDLTATDRAATGGSVPPAR